MKTLLLLCALGLLVMAGCTQIVGQAGNDLSTCLEKCNNLCELTNKSNFSLGGFNSISLAKQSGAVKVYCSCLCNP